VNLGPHSPSNHPCQEELQRPQSAHPSLAPQGHDINHLSPSYQSEARRSSLSGPCQMNLQDSPSPHLTHYLNPLETYRNQSTSYSELQDVGNQAVKPQAGNNVADSEQTSEVWQDIVRQLAVS